MRQPMYSRLTLLVMALLVTMPVTPVIGQSMEGGARAAALGGASTALLEDVWGFSNPAVWGTHEGRALSFYATESFGLSELRLAAVQAVEPLPFATLAAGVRTFGFEDFRELHINVGAARGFSLGTARTFHLGINVRYYSVSITNYGNANTVGISLGWLTQVAPNVHVGFHALNLNQPDWQDGDALERAISFGMSYTPTDQALLALDVLKDVRFPLAVRGGIEFAPVRSVYLRTGVTTEPTRYTAGVGVHLGRIVADVAAENHQDLGWSPGVSLGLEW